MTYEAIWTRSQALAFARLSRDHDGPYTVDSLANPGSLGPVSISVGSGWEMVEYVVDEHGTVTDSRGVAA